LPVGLLAQTCEVKVGGRIQDGSSSEPIAYANVFFKEALQGAVSDEEGFFELPLLCRGTYHVVVSHIGCQTKEFYLSVYQDTVMVFELDHNSQLLDELAISSTLISETTTQELVTMDAHAISQNTDKNIANMLDNLAGVSTLKNGNNIAKPIVNGLYGNRLILLNNGVAQSGQQWGADHSPEIDPLAADKITVIKGVGALEYQGSNLGSVILVTPHKIDNEPHLHGKARYFFESNGLGNGLNIRLQQHLEKLAWSVVGTAKKKGDSRASDYYLTNTGSSEGDLALQLEYAHNPLWKSEVYISSFNARLGVLRGAHIGNLTDLEEALTREKPFYTQDQFSYQITSPSQNVNHHLLKLHTKFVPHEDHQFDLTYATQWDIRKEFDVRRGGRSDIAALDLNQMTQFVEGKYKRYFSNDWELASGMQFNRIDNVNSTSTGILPLIPDYISFETGIFVLASKKTDRMTFELGGRYDYLDQRVAAISISLPREILRYYNHFNNLSAASGFSYSFSKFLNASYNLGLVSRNPAINELYSNGLHQGVSGIEEGDPNLKREQSLKNTFSLGGSLNQKILFELLYYDQRIENYIFLNPQDELRATIRGSFPVFKYTQATARIFGFDVTSTFLISDQLNMVLRSSFLKGTDIQNERPLIYMPSNNLFSTVNYQMPQVGNWEQVEFQISSKYVFEQKNILSSQDFTRPPEGYHLVGLKISGERQLKNNRLNIFLRIDNLLNVAYRDYLNRQRYFADDLGINFVTGVNLNF
jgi:iron complex outermembrane recepter protein